MGTLGHAEAMGLNDGPRRADDAPAGKTKPNRIKAAFTGLPHR